MHPAHIFFVQPRLPEVLQPLRVLGYDLYWHDNLETEALFCDLDPVLWEKCGHNPVMLLRQIPDKRLKDVAANDKYVGQLNWIWDKYQFHHKETISLSKYGLAKDTVIAYFSAEFGLAQALPMYSGGLGILAGDHLKSASDLNLPLVGVGLLYKQGYFHQRLDKHGWQQEIYPDYNFYDLPLKLVTNDDGSPKTIKLNFPERLVTVQIWRVKVGRITLYLLDTNCPENNEADKSITDVLYGGDKEKRIQQEIVLGIGGMRALEALGIEETICHLNEGHSAFLGLERIKQLREKYNLDFASARELASSGNIFTTHTPVPAGIDVFPIYLIDKYLTHYYQSLGLSRNEFLSLGRQDPYNQQEEFNMAVLALRLSSWANGVSKLHGQTARRMWQGLWPELPLEETPITSITNGIHVPTWIGGRMAALYEKYLGSDWRENASNEKSWDGLDEIPDEELWMAHEKQREDLLRFVQERLTNQSEVTAADRAEITAAGRLDPKALTIGFARRFATYKRPNLLFYDMERLAGILRNSKRPVQFVFAGKAHPRDDNGKKLIQQIINYSRQFEFQSKIFFIEDYDINAARHMIQGVDVWLANPRRPLEASATSGMKAVINGALHVSTLDGWWAEAYSPELGWAIGNGEIYNDLDYQDHIEAQYLYNLLEDKIIPLFYDRDDNGLPKSWLKMMRKSIKTFAPTFNTHRMLNEYIDKLYAPASQLYQKLEANNQEKAKALAAWKDKMYANWSQVKIEKIEDNREKELEVGNNIPVRAEIYLGLLKPEDVNVEIYYGMVDDGNIIKGNTVKMYSYQPQGEGRYVYTGTIPCDKSGRQGYNLRIKPYHEDLAHPYLSGLITWG